MTGVDLDFRLSADMRLAFTRATLIFPKTVNRDPLVLAVYRVFYHVFYTLKREHRLPLSTELYPFEPGFLVEVGTLVDKAVADIYCRGVANAVLAGSSTVEAKKYAPFIAGLPYSEAKALLGLVKSKAPRVSRQRATMLRNRHNMLANGLVEDSRKAAREYFLSEVGDA